MQKKFIGIIISAVILFCFSLTCSAEEISKSVFERESINLYPSQTYRVAYIDTDDTSDSLYLMSSNEKIAVVSYDGIVTAVSAGTADILAVYADGTQTKCKVNVKKGVSPESVSIDFQNITIAQGDTKKLDAKVYPENVVDNSVYYYSSDTSIATVDEEGNIKGIKGGLAIITAESASCAVSSQCIVKVVSSLGNSDYDANLKGTLYTISGEKKDNAIIELRNAKESIRETTDSSGYFEFEDIPQGSYIISFYKNSDTKKASAYSQINISSYDVNISCIINNGELVVLFNGSTDTNDVKDITLEKSMLILDVGESYDMTYTVRPSNAGTPILSASSSNDEVAVVDSQGRIIAVSEGKASIVFSTKDGKITKTCAVTVTSVNSNTYSWVIILVETSIFGIGFLIFSCMYRAYIRKKEKEEK